MWHHIEWTAVYEFLVCVGLTGYIGIQLMDVIKNKKKRKSSFGANLMIVIFSVSSLAGVYLILQDVIRFVNLLTNYAF